MALHLASIVEGKGELEAVPVLIRRILAENNIHDAVILQPVRVRRNKVLKDSDIELSRAIQHAIEKFDNIAGSILILIDSEGDRAVEISNRLARRAHDLRSDLPIHVVVAHTKYETWFLAGVNTLAGERGLQHNLPNPPSAEAVQDPKRWLKDHMAGSRTYSETTDQAAFSAAFDMSAARRNSRSFDKFYRTVCEVARSVRRPR